MIIVLLQFFSIFGAETIPRVISYISRKSRRPKDACCGEGQVRFSRRVIILLQDAWARARIAGVPRSGQRLTQATSGVSQAPCVTPLSVSGRHAYTHPARRASLVSHRIFMGAVHPEMSHQGGPFTSNRVSSKLTCHSS